MFVGVELKRGDKVFEFEGYGIPKFSVDGQRMLLTDNKKISTFAVSTGNLLSDLSTVYSNTTDDGGQVYYSNAKPNFWNNKDLEGYQVGVVYGGVYTNYKTKEQHYTKSQMLIFDTNSDQVIHSVLDLPPFNFPIFLQS